MTIDDNMIQVLAGVYFSGEMPEDLRLYLLDIYGTEPLRGDLEPQFFWPAVKEDIQSYIRGELDTTVRTELQKLQDRYDELSGILTEFAEMNRWLEEEFRYMSDFIAWTKQNKQYEFFRENAHEEKDEYGFLRFVLRL